MLEEHVAKPETYDMDLIHKLFSRSSQTPAQ